MSFPPKTLGEIETEITMRRTGYSGPYLLLEGDGDSRFWRKHTRISTKEIITCSGRTNVWSATRLVETKGLGPSLSILDDDYDSILGVAIPSANILLTDTRDLETMLLSSAALEAVIEELGDTPKIHTYIAKTGLTPRDALIGLCLPFGMARCISIRDGYHVDFGRFPAIRYLDPGWSIRLQNFKTDFANAIGKSILTLDAEFAALAGTDPWRLIQGHDAIQMLRAGLSETLGSVNISNDLLGAFLRSAFDTTMLQGMPLWGRITSWEASNAVKLVSI